MSWPSFEASCPSACSWFRSPGCDPVPSVGGPALGGLAASRALALLVRLRRLSAALGGFASAVRLLPMAPRPHEAFCLSRGALLHWVRGTCCVVHSCSRRHPVPTRHVAGYGGPCFTEVDARVVACPQGWFLSRCRLSSWRCPVLSAASGGVVARVAFLRFVWWVLRPPPPLLSRTVVYNLGF